MVSKARPSACPQGLTVLPGLTVGRQRDGCRENNDFSAGLWYKEQGMRSLTDPTCRPSSAHDELGNLG